MREAPFADPSRLYSEARRSRTALDSSRASCAAAIGARPEAVTFTSGGTEAIALAIHSAAEAAEAARRPKRILISRTEQRSILEAISELEGFEVVLLDVDSHGLIDPSQLAQDLALGASLVCIQVGNGEIGTLQPLQEIAAVMRESKAWWLADATYAAGWIHLDVENLGADLLPVSGGRCGGPPGSGFLWARPGVRLRPQFRGDDRERGIRAGMPNVPALVGLGAGLSWKVAELDSTEPRLRLLTEQLRSGLTEVLDEVIVHGHETRRLPHIVSFSVPMVEGDTMLLALDREGFSVHSGSACASSTAEPSHVLAAIGTLTHGAIRVALGPESSEADVAGFLGVLPGIVAASRATLTRDD